MIKTLLTLNAFIHVHQVIGAADDSKVVPPWFWGQQKQTQSDLEEARQTIAVLEDRLKNKNTFLIDGNEKLKSKNAQIMKENSDLIKRNHQLTTERDDASEMNEQLNAALKGAMQQRDEAVALGQQLFRQREEAIFRQQDQRGRGLDVRYLNAEIARMDSVIRRKDNELRQLVMEREAEVREMTLLEKEIERLGQENHFLRTAEEIKREFGERGGVYGARDGSETDGLTEGSDSEPVSGRTLTFHDRLEALWNNLEQEAKDKNIQ